jgi:hypothetical protein
MNTLAMKPIQIHLRPAQIETARSVADRRGVSLAELVRQALDAYLAEMPAEEDPLWNIIGSANAGPTDLAANHDKYLAEAIAEEGRAWHAKSS